MSILRMEPENIQDLAQKAKYTASDLYDSAQTVQNLARSAEWQGPSRDEFIQDLQHIISKLYRMLDELEFLGEQLDKEVQEWVDAGSLFGKQ